MKFIHLANVALLSEKRTLGRFEADCGKEFREDFEQVLSVCRRDQIDALFITGNLFCRVPDPKDLMDLDESFASLGETRVFILPGEKDAPESAALLKSYEWKSRTTVFAGDCVDRVNVSKLNAEITGVGYSKETWSRVKASKLTRGRKAALQILLLPFVGESASDPLPEDFEPAAFDYIGIGQYSYLQPEGKGAVCSPGLFEPDGFSEQLKHGYFVGELDPEKRGAQRLKISFVPGARREYITVRLNVTKSSSYSDVEARLKQTIAYYGEDSVYSVVLEGQASPSLWYLKEGLYYLGNVAEIKGDPDHKKAERWYDSSLTGEAIRRYLSKIPEDADQEDAEQAAFIGKQALFGLQNSEMII